VGKIVLDAGPEHVGHWREHRRHLARDFERAFGEPPGPAVDTAPPAGIC